MTLPNLEKELSVSSPRLVVGIKGEIKTLDDDNPYIKIERTVKKDMGGFVVFTQITNISKQDVVLKYISPFNVKIQSFSKHVKAIRNCWTITGGTQQVPILNYTEGNTILDRDKNPYSYKKEFGYIDNSIVSEWYTAVEFGTGSLFCGAVTTGNSYTTNYITYKETEGHLYISVEPVCQLDNKIIGPNCSIRSETVFLGLGVLSDLERRFVDLLKKNTKVNVSFKPLRGIIMPFYYKGNYLDKKVFDAQIGALKVSRLYEDMSYFVLDAGYCRYWGDWLERIRFPEGLSYAARKIKEVSLTPGIWIAPLVADPRSSVYKENPNWFINDPYLRKNVRYYSKIDRFLPRWGLKLANSENDEYFAYIKTVAREFYSMGFRLFKLDFLYPLGFSQSCSKFTRVESLRRYLEVFKGLGEDTVVATAISQLSPLVGMVDIARVASDTTSPYLNLLPVLGKSINSHRGLEIILSSKSKDRFNHRLWLNDYDAFVFLRDSPPRRYSFFHQNKKVFETATSLWFGGDLTAVNKDQLEFLHKTFALHKELFN